MKNNVQLIDFLEDGEHLSPILPEHIKNYLIDIAKYHTTDPRKD